MFLLKAAVAVGAVLLVTWGLFMVVLLAFRPRGISFSEAKRLVPDIMRLLRALRSDPTLPSGVRRRLTLLLVYLASPIDLVPDFIPVLGYADDVIVVAVVLRSVARLAGAEAIDRHWTGSEAGLALIRQLVGLPIVDTGAAGTGQS